MLLVDVSASGQFGSVRQDQERAGGRARAAARVLARSRNNDKVGLILFTDRVELFIPPQKGTQPRAARDPRDAVLRAAAARHRPRARARVPAQGVPAPHGHLPDLRLPGAGLREAAAPGAPAPRPGADLHRRPAGDGAARPRPDHAARSRDRRACPDRQRQRRRARARTRSSARPPQPPAGGCSARSAST